MNRVLFLSALLVWGGHSASVLPTLEDIFFSIGQTALDNNAPKVLDTTCFDMFAAYQQAGCCDIFPLEGNATIEVTQECLGVSQAECLTILSARNVLLGLGFNDAELELSFQLPVVNETLGLEDWYDASFDALIPALPKYLNLYEQRLNVSQCPLGRFAPISEDDAIAGIDVKLSAYESYGQNVLSVTVRVDGWNNFVFNATNELLQRFPLATDVTLYIQGPITNTSLGLPPALSALENLRGFMFAAGGFEDALLNDVLSLPVEDLAVYYPIASMSKTYDGFVDIILPALQAHPRTGLFYRGIVNTTLDLNEFSIPSELASNLTHFHLSFDVFAPSAETIVFPQFISNFTSLVGLIISDNNENSGTSVVGDWPTSYASLSQLVALKISVQQITNFPNFTTIYPDLLFLQADFFQSSPVRVPNEFFLKSFGEVRLDGELQVFVESSNPICSSDTCLLDYTGDLALFMCDANGVTTFCCGQSCIDYTSVGATQSSSLETILTNAGYTLGVDVSYFALTPSFVSSLDIADSGTSLNTEWLWNIALLKAGTSSGFRLSLDMIANTTDFINPAYLTLSNALLNPRSFNVTFTTNARYSDLVQQIYQRCTTVSSFRFNNEAFDPSPSGFFASLNFNCFFTYIDFGEFGDVGASLISMLFSNSKMQWVWYYRHIQSSAIASYSSLPNVMMNSQFRHLELQNAVAFNAIAFPGSLTGSGGPLRTLKLKDCPVLQFTPNFIEKFPRVHTLHMISASYDALFPDEMWELPLINVDLSHNPLMTGSIPRAVFERNYERFSIENTQLNGTVYSSDPICSNPPDVCHLSSHTVCADGPLSCNCTGGGPTCFPGFILQSTGFQSMAAGMGETLLDVLVGDLWNTTNPVYTVVSIESGQLKLRYYNSTGPGSSPGVTFLHSLTGINMAACTTVIFQNSQEAVLCSVYTSSFDFRNILVRFNNALNVFEAAYDNNWNSGGSPGTKVLSSFQDLFNQTSLAVYSTPSGDDYDVFDVSNGNGLADSVLTDRFNVADGFGPPTGNDEFGEIRQADFNNDGLPDYVLQTEDDNNSADYITVYLNGNTTAIFRETITEVTYDADKIAVGHFSNSSIGPDFYYRQGVNELVLCLNPLGDTVFNCSTRLMNVGVDSIITTVTNMLGGADGVALRVYDPVTLTSYITIIEEDFQVFTLPTAVPNRVQSVFVPKYSIDDYMIVYVDPTANTLNWATFDVTNPPV